MKELEMAVVMLCCVARQLAIKPMDERGLHEL